MTTSSSVVVGSMNPVKIESVELAFQAVWPSMPWHVSGIKARSGVLEQPLTENETIEGARNRAIAALASGSEFGVGLEGGLTQMDGRWMECGCVVIRNADGLEGIASTARIPIPERFRLRMKQGETLGDICDETFRVANVGEDVGYFGLMTNNAVTRSSAYRDAVAFALATFVHPPLFAHQVGAAGM